MTLGPISHLDRLRAGLKAKEAALAAARRVNPAYLGALVDDVAQAKRALERAEREAAGIQWEHTPVEPTREHPYVIGVDPAEPE